MALSTDAAIKRFGENEERVNQFVNGENGYTTNTNVFVKSLIAFLNSMGYEPPVSYAAGILLNSPTKTVEYNGSIYAPILAQMPFTTSGTFETTKFRVIQGITDVNLLSWDGRNLGDIIRSELGAEGTERTFVGGVLKSTYAEPRSRFAIGQEYLWAVQKQMLISEGSGSYPVKIVWSGDSTTFGVYAGTSTLDNVSKNWALKYGFSNITNINAGHSGESLVAWEATGGWLDQDMTSYADMNCYIIRWGLNDGSSWSHDLTALETRIRSGLTRLRAWKTAANLSIILMVPNSASENGTRDEAWLEGVSKIYKEVAREFQCCFIDTYAIWRDTRGVALNHWVDDAGSGQGIHPDAVFNHWIVDAVSELLYRPMSVGPSVRNLFTNFAAGASNVTLSTLPGDAKFNYGISIYRTDTPLTFPFSGSVITTRTADGIFKQELIGFENNVKQRSIFRYSVGGNAWSEWRGLAYQPTLLNSWLAYDGVEQLVYHKSQDGTVYIEGRVKNASSAISRLFILPVGFRPLQNMRFIIHNYDATSFGSIQVGSDGNVIFANGPNTDCNIRCLFKAWN